MKTTALAAGLLGAIAFGAAAYGIDSAMDATRTLMSPIDRDHELRAIESRTRTALAACRGATEHVRPICRLRARAEDRVARAELDARYFGTVQAEESAREVRARARFQVARAECLDGAASERARCLSAARADEAKALAHAMVASTI